MEVLEDRTVPSGFSDGFEGAALDPFWYKTEQSGSVRLSTAMAHSGRQSVEMVSTEGNGNKGVGINHAFPSPVYGRVSVWLYDNGAGVSSSNYMILNAGDNQENAASLYTGDYDLGPGNGGSYYYNPFEVYQAFNTGVVRSQAWHLFSINSTPSAVTMQIDGVTVHQAGGGHPLTLVSLSLAGPTWRPAWTGHFDDFEFTPYGTDITPTKLAWNPTQGGVDFGYKVSGAALTQDTTAQLYWASGTTTDTILGPAATPIPIPKTTPVDQVQSVHLASSDFPGGPAPGARYLLAVVDPDNKIDEGVEGEKNNVATLAYTPTLSVQAKYDGDPRDSFMGRYFAGTDVLKDNIYTVKLSDSLDALRPKIEVRVGSQILDAYTLPGTVDTFVTSTFDPGSLPPGNIPLVGEALLWRQDAADFSANVLVVPIPGWAKALRDFNVTFDPNGDGPGAPGAYVFDGLLPNLSLGGTVFTIPKDVPLVGGQALQFSAGFEVKTVAPLAVSSPPTLEGGLHANLTLGKSISLPVVYLPPAVRLDDDNWKLTVTPGAKLDALTRDSPNGFSLSLALDGKVPRPLQATLFDAFAFVYPFGVPVALEFEVTAALEVMLHAHAQVVYTSAGLEFLPGGTYLGVGLEGSVTATAQAGWFAPAWVQNFLNLRYGRTFRPPTLALKDTAAVSLSADAEAHFVGPVRSPTYSGLLFKGSAKFSNKLELLFQIGDSTIFDLVIADLTKKSPDYAWTLP